MLIEHLCLDQDCLVIGSAPIVDIPDRDFGCVLAANGGVAIAIAAGLPVDCLVTTSHLFRGNNISEAEAWTIDSMSGAAVDHVWADTKNGPLSWVAGGCSKALISYNEIYNVTPPDREEVIVDAVGENLWVSSGVWAACLAFSSGASSVHISGISLQNGHYGMDDNAPRDHVIQDRRCLELMQQIGARKW